MKNKQNTQTSVTAKVAAIGGIVLLGLGALGGANLFPRTDVVTNTVTETVYQEVPVEKIVEVEVPVEVIKEVVTNNDEYDATLRVLTALNGDVDLVTDGLDDLDVAEVSDRFVMAADMLAVAEQKVRDRGIDELDGESVTLLDNTSLVLDEDDMARLRVSDDPGFAAFTDFDFEEGDAVVVIEGSVRQDGKTFDVEFEVSFRDGEYRRMEVLSVSQRP